MSKWIKVQLKHSAIGREESQKDTLRGLGLRHRHQVRVLQDTPQIWGMVRKVIHLVDAESISSKSEKKELRQASYKLGTVVEIAKKPKHQKPKAAESKEGEAGSKKKVAKKKSSAKKKTPAKHAVKPVHAKKKSAKK